MKKTSKQRLEFVQGLLFSASTELKALIYESTPGDDVHTSATVAETQIDEIAIALNRAKAQVSKAEPSASLFTRLVSR